MKLARMRFKSFVWPHNPRVYSIEFERSMALNKIPFGRYALQDLGLSRRIMRGEGEFVGEDAYRTFQQLATVFYEGSPGTLVHPLWDTTSAWLVELKLEQEPREDYVRYSFTFWEELDLARTAPVLVRTGGGSGAAGAVSVSAAAGTGEISTGGSSPGEGSTGESGAVWHTVVKGECLWGIAVDYGVSLESLIALNPQIGNPNLIYVGQKVRVV